MNNHLFLDYQFIDGRSQYYIDPYEDYNRILPFCVAVSVIEGEYFVDFEDGSTICVREGETVFIQSLIWHTVRMTKRGKLTHAHFLCSYVTMDILSLANLPFFVVKSTRVHDLLFSINRTLFQNTIAQKMYTDQIICELFLLFVDFKILNIENIIVEPWLNSVLQFIHSNLSKGITVDDVVAVSGYSRTGFHKLFKSRMKISPHEYIEQERLKTASLLLLKGNKVKEVAKIMGYNDVSYFNKVFKRRYGITPLEYKLKLSYRNGE